jgi:hypothetical protein
MRDNIRRCAPIAEVEIHDRARGRSRFGLLERFEQMRSAICDRCAGERGAQMISDRTENERMILKHDERVAGHRHTIRQESSA